MCCNDEVPLDGRGVGKEDRRKEEGTEEKKDRVRN